MENFSLEKANQLIKESFARFEEYEANFDKYFELYKDHGNGIVHRSEPKGEPVIIRGGKLIINTTPEKALTSMRDMSWEKRKKLTAEVVKSDAIEK
jgi:hypothetical protein